MTNENTVSLSLCQDCTYYLQNGELPPDSSERRDEMITNGADRIASQYKLTGWNSEFTDHAVTSCDCCRSRLHGERYGFNAEEKHNHKKPRP